MLRWLLANIRSVIFFFPILDTGKKAVAFLIINKRVLNPSEKKNVDISHWLPEHSDYLFRYALSRVGKREIAEDLVQDTFLAAVKAMGSFKGESSERTWLTSILRNKLLDYFKKKSNQNELKIGKDDIEHQRFFETEGARKGLWTAEGRPGEWPTDYKTLVEEKEFYEILHTCIGKLPQKPGTVFRMKHLEDLDFKEICKELDISTSNYWVLMHRAKLQLQKCMTLNWFNERKSQ